MLLLSCGVYASSSENPASGMDEWIISDEAGAYGYYEYDLETKEGHFVPPSEIPEADYEPVPAEIPDEIFDTDEPDADITPFSVIGTDLRSKVSSPSGRYASTCLIASRFGPNDNDVSKGTGWLLNNSYLVTAGHLLYDPDYTHNDNKGYALHVAVYVGSSGGTYKQYRKGHKYKVGTNYANAPADSGGYFLEGIKDDWGIVKLETPLTVNVGHLGRRQVNNASQMTASRYYTQGYPVDRNIGTYGTSWWKYDMYTSYGEIKQDASLYTVYTTLDTDGGMSGGPVYYLDSNLGYCADAIHVAGTNGGVRPYNTALLITPDLWKIIKEVT